MCMYVLTTFMFTNTSSTGPRAMTTLQNAAQGQQSVSSQQPEEMMLTVRREGTTGESMHSELGERR